MTMLLWLGAVIAFWGMFFWGIANASPAIPELVFYASIPVGFVMLLALWQSWTEESEEDELTSALKGAFKRKKKEGPWRLP